MTTLVGNKRRIQDFLMDFLAKTKADELRVEYDDNLISIKPVHDVSVLEILSSQAEDLGPADLSVNVDHYLYGLPKK